MKKGNISLSAATAASLTIGGALPRQAKDILFSNAGAAVVYGIVNWNTGDTEVSASNFHFLLKAGDNLRVGFPALVSERISLVRLISASVAVVGYLSE